MEKKRNSTTWLIPILIVLLSLTLLSSWYLGSLYARYTTQSTGEDSARVAVFGQNASVTLAGNVTDTMTPGTSFSYNLTVSNADADRISEVAENYSIEVVTAGNLPLQYTLKKADTSENTETDSWKFTESSSEKTKTFTGDNMQFAAGKREEHRYILEVQWPEDKNSASLAGIPDFIQVNINVAQAD